MKPKKGSIVYIPSGFFTGGWGKEQFGDEHKRTYLVGRLGALKKEVGSDRNGYAFRCFGDDDDFFISTKDAKTFIVAPNIDAKPLIGNYVPPKALKDRPNLIA